MKHLAIIAALMATPAAAFDGLTIGASVGAGQFITEPKNTVDDFSLKGVHARFLWRAEGTDLLLGGEMSRLRLSGTILNKERADWLTDVSAVVGIDMGDWMPHVVAGYSHLRTSLHGSDGYHVGLGVSRKISENFQVTFRGTYREFDGPAQGSDLLAPTVSLMFEYNF